ncbi:unnamed protein product [Adineta ricciae]|uniref:Uncharacterized protein n=1 Tax=Adineta ricciae TaxID=249248 RepID=A0A814T6Z0_ADIRI|nr:unnamed protein product [Adineta ricciae]CAF1195659.1 unnamed protein product [Adineta ricciae]
MLIKRWQLLGQAFDDKTVDHRLSIQHLPHNVKVRYDFSIKEATHWKAKHGRLFVLHVGLPILFDILPVSYLFHFAVYALAIKLLHAPEDKSEIDLADRLLNFYCQSSSLVYDSTIELYSLHAHLHLADQVRHHGGLSYTSAFAFESCIRYTKSKAHGVRNLASQIAYWTDMTSIVDQPVTMVEEPCGIDEITLQNPSLDRFRSTIIKFSGTLSVKIYKRFKRPFT